MRTYLDYAATSPVDPEVLKTMMTHLSGTFGNPSSLYREGRESAKVIEEAREKIAHFAGADHDEIIFTSGGTESNNTAIKGVAFAKKEKGSHIITSSIEHHAVTEPCRFLRGQGFNITFLPVDRHGLVDPDHVKKAITGKTILITIMHANNEIGTIQHIKEIGAIAREAGVCFHTDAVQTFGHLRLNVDELNVDLMSASAHKLCGPKGTGVLYARKGVRFTPLLAGGDQERNRRASTENVPAIAGLGKAVELAGEKMDEEAARLGGLRDKLIKTLFEKIDNIYLNGHPERRLPNNANISIEFVEGESLVLNLDMEGISVSTGSACTSSSLEPSHVLKALGMEPELAHGSLRVTSGRFTREEDIDNLCDVLPAVVKKLRAMSPLYKK